MYTNKSFGARKTEAIVTEIPECPADTISDISFSPDGTAMAVASWDSTVSIYTMKRQGGLGTYGSTQVPKRERSYNLSKPVLSVAFFGSITVAGLVDGTLVCIDPSGRIDTVQAHGEGVKGLKNYNDQFIITGSFDQSLKVWDLKSAQPLSSLVLPGKVYSMSLVGPMLCVGLSNKTVQVYDMRNFGMVKAFTVRFNYGIRSIGCLGDMDCFAVGGVEAKIELMSCSVEAKKYIVRAHRENAQCFSVNLVRFCPIDSNVLVSGGADGSLVWFDRLNRTKLSTLTYGSPVTAGEFSADNSYFVFATGDDWSKGYTGEYVKPVLRMVDIKSIPSLNK
ncbi:mRNA export factor [Pancytospora epiphaga]|nr:mRNA export factor [Pancytospora epiphaga]